MSTYLRDLTARDSLGHIRSPRRRWHWVLQATPRLIHELAARSVASLPPPASHSTRVRPGPAATTARESCSPYYSHSRTVCRCSSRTDSVLDVSRIGTERDKHAQIIGIHSLSSQVSLSSAAHTHPCGICRSDKGTNDYCARARSALFLSLALRLLPHSRRCRHRPIPAARSGAGRAQ